MKPSAKHFGLAVGP